MCFEEMYFFKQKTAHEMRISDWSSDVCSSDLTCVSSSVGAAPGCTTTTCTAGNSTSGLSFTSIRLKLTRPASSSRMNRTIGGTELRMHQAEMLRKLMGQASSCGCGQIGRASCGEGGGQYVWFAVGAVPLKKKKKR